MAGLSKVNDLGLGKMFRLSSLSIIVGLMSVKSIGMSFKKQKRHPMTVRLRKIRSIADLWVYRSLSYRVTADKWQDANLKNKYVENNESFNVFCSVRLIWN